MASQCVASARSPSGPSSRNVIVPRVVSVSATKNVNSRRDSSLNGQDSFQMIFDTYHDKQNGFIFGTNSVGIQYDAQVRNEGETLRGGAFTGVGGGTVNCSSICLSSISLVRGEMSPWQLPTLN